jgi:uncharacterized protein
MEFEWDPAKAVSVLEKHGILFEDATEIFEGDFLDLSTAYPAESRRLAIGELRGRIVVVIYTRRGSAFRLITARRARDNEERAYRAHVVGRSSP